MKLENINNLTSLWKTVGLSMNSYNSNNKLESVIVEGSEWPNKIWAKGDLTSELITEVKDITLSSTENISFPYWNNFNNEKFLFENNGFKIKSEQVGMSLKLSSKFDFERRISLKEITKLNEALIWEDNYPMSFGYRISKEIVLAANNSIKFYLVSYNDEIIGTAIMYFTGKIAGIHGVGVIPSYRRKGFAEEIMKVLLNDALEYGADYSTLQASSMGKGIYERLGYSEDFLISNYIMAD